MGGCGIFEVLMMKMTITIIRQLLTLYNESPHTISRFHQLCILATTYIISWKDEKMFFYISGVLQAILHSLARLCHCWSEWLCVWQRMSQCYWWVRLVPARHHQSSTWHSRWVSFWCNISPFHPNPVQLNLFIKQLVFLQYAHKRHSIAGPGGWTMECLL